MSRFNTAQEIYNCLGEFYKETFLENPQMINKLSELGKVVRYYYTEPEAQITYFVDKDKVLQFDMGETNLVPDITMSMKGDLAHQYQLGKVNLVVAMTRGQIKTKGPIQPLLKLQPMGKVLIAKYPVWLAEKGFDKLEK